MVVMAEEEARLVSTYTRDLLKAAKARGMKLGTASNLTDDARRLGSVVGVKVRRAAAAQRGADLAPQVYHLRRSWATYPKGIAAP